MDIVPAFSEVRGFQTDPPPDEMPKGYMRRAKNMIPGNRLRGGWKYASPNVVGNPSRVTGLVWAPTILSGATVDYTASLFIADQAGSDTKFYSDATLNGATNPTLVGTVVGNDVLYPLVHHRNLVIAILTANTTGLGSRSGLVKKLTRSTIASLGGAPPPATKVASWGEYLLLADSDANPNRIWFSGVGTVDTWDLTTGYVDVPDRIVALYAKGNTIFIWTPSGCHLLLGDTPPPGGNLTLKKNAFAQGCSDPYSITQYKDYVIWANQTGVFKSDGSQPVNLTDLGGISSYWQFVMTNRDSDWGPVVGIASGLYESTLLVSVRKTVGVGLYTSIIFVCDLETNNWFTWGYNVSPGGFDPTCFAARNQDKDSSFTGHETFFGSFVDSHVGSLSSCFLPTTNVDADGSKIDLDLWTPAYRFGGQGKKRVKRIFPSYLFEDVETSAALLNSQFGTSFTQGDDPSKFSQAVSGPSWSNFANAGKMNRVPGMVGRQAESIWFRLYITTTDTFQRFTLGGLDVEVSGLEQSRAGDLYA